MRAMIEIAPSQIYTIRDVAEYFKCSTRKVHRLIATGQLRGFKIGNQRRFKGDEILRFIEQQDNGTDESPVIASAIQPDRLYSAREVSSLLQIPASEATALLRTGRLPGGFRVGMEWRCWGRDLNKLVDEMNEYNEDDEGEGKEPKDEIQPPLLAAEPAPSPAAAKPASKEGRARHDDAAEPSA